MKILIISPVPTHPTTSGNSTRILSLAEVLRGLSHEVYFFHIDFQKGDHESMRQYWENRFIPYAYQKPWKKYRFFKVPVPDRWHHGMLSRGWLAQTIDQFFDDGVLPVLDELQQEIDFDAVMVEYVFFSKALEVFPGKVLKIIDTHDVYTDRHKRLLEQGLQPEWFFTRYREEKKGLRRAHRVIAIQDQEAAFFQSMLGRRSSISTAGHLFKMPSENRISPIKNPLRFGFIGSSNSLNLQAINWFLEEVMPLFPDEIRDEFQLDIWGSVCDFLEIRPGVHLRGSIEDVRQAYDQADVFINPIQWGTGLKIKTIEALSFGRLVLTTPCGIEGLENAEGDGCKVPESAEDWVKQILYFYKNAERLPKASENNYKFARAYLCRQVSQLKRILSHE